MAALAMAPARQLLEELLLGQPASPVPSAASAGEDGEALQQGDGAEDVRSQRLGAAELHACLLRVRHREAATQRRITEILGSHAPHFQSLLEKAYDATLESQALRQRLSYIAESVLGGGSLGPGTASEPGVSDQAFESRDTPHAGGTEEVRTLADWQQAIGSAASEFRTLREQHAAQRKVVRAAECTVSTLQILHQSRELESSGQLVQASRLVVRLREALQGSSGAQAAGTQAAAGTPGGGLEKREAGSAEPSCSVIGHISQLAAERSQQLLATAEGALRQLCTAEADAASGRFTLRTGGALEEAALPVGREGTQSGAQAADVPPLGSTMDALTVLLGSPGPAWSRMAEPLLSCVVRPFLREPLRELSVHQGDALLQVHLGPPPGPAAQLNREQVVTEHLYPKLLALLRALKAFLGGLSSESGDCFRVLWQLLWPRIADAIISLHLSKALPMETRQLAAFRSLQQRTEAFEAALRSDGILAPAPEDAQAEEGPDAGAESSSMPRVTRGELLMQFAADVDLHFAARKRVRLLAQVRSILLAPGEFSSSVVHMEPNADVLQARGISLDEAPDAKGQGQGQGRSNGESLASHHSVLHWEPCHVSTAAQSVLALVQETMTEACSSTERTSPELYKAARDAVTLFRAIACSEGRGSAWRDVPQLAMLLHNDFLYIGHRLLTLSFELRPRMPQHLRSNVVFVDMAPFLWEEAANVAGGIEAKYRHQLMEALDGAHGFAHTDREEGYAAAMRALKQVHHQLTQLASVLQPVMAPTLFRRFLNQLLDAVLTRCCSEVLSLRDISVDETVHLRKLFLGFLERIPPIYEAGASEATKQLPGSTDAPSLLPRSFQKLQRLTDILDMPLRAITQSWRSGELSSAGFTAHEVYHAITAIFSDTPLRRDCLAQVIPPQ